MVWSVELSVDVLAFCGLFVGVEVWLRTNTCPRLVQRAGPGSRQSFREGNPFVPSLELPYTSQSLVRSVLCNILFPLALKELV